MAVSAKFAGDVKAIIADHFETVFDRIPVEHLCRDASGNGRVDLLPMERDGDSMIAHRRHRALAQYACDHHNPLAQRSSWIARLKPTHAYNHDPYKKVKIAMAPNVALTTRKRRQPLSLTSFGRIVSRRVVWNFAQRKARKIRNPGATRQLLRLGCEAGNLRARTHNQ